MSGRVLRSVQFAGREDVRRQTAGCEVQASGADSIDDSRHRKSRLRIIGTGIDLVCIERVGRVLAEYQRPAGRFAGKEAVMKSMGTGWRRIRWKDVEVTGGGRPSVRFYGPANQRAEMLGVTGFEVSMTPLTSMRWCLPQHSEGIEKIPNGNPPTAAVAHAVA